jgi:hypothetical protein
MYALPQLVVDIAMGWDWVSLLRGPLFGLLCQLRMVDDGECGMNSRGIGSTRWRRLWRIPSSGMLRRVALVRTYFSEECIASIIRVKRVSGLGTLSVTNSRHTLGRNNMYYYILLCNMYVYYIFVRNVLRLLVTADVPSSQILVSLMMEAILSFETSVPRRGTRRHVP